MANAYDKGEGLQKDDIEAAMWYEVAAARGHPVAAKRLAVMHLEGRGVEANDKKALHLLRQARLTGLSHA